MHDRYLVFNGVDLKEKYGLMFSDFQEENPKAKVYKVEIPAGLDLDITDSLGYIGYHNGKHTFTFLSYGNTEERRLEIQRGLNEDVHGKMASYILSWDPDYTYKGRADVQFKHLFENADVITITIERYPWKATLQQVVDINSHPTGSYFLENSIRYHNVKISTLQPSTTKVGSESAVSHVGAGTFDLADDIYGDTEIVVTVADWLLYIDGHNVVINPEYYTLSGTDVEIDDIYTIDSGDITFALEAKQHSTLRFARWDR